MSVPPYPKIELHVHLEATVRPERLLELGRRNDVEAAGPHASGAWRRFCRFRSFDGFIRVWVKTTRVLRHRRDFREIVVDYACRARRTGLLLRRAAVLAVGAGAAGRVVAGGLRGLLRRRRGGARAARRGAPLHAGHHAQLPAGGRRAARRSGRCASATAAWPASASAGASTASRRRRSRGPSPSPARAGSRPRRTPARPPGPRPSAPRWTTCTPTACGTACAPSRTRRCSPSWPGGASSATSRR